MKATLSTKLYAACPNCGNDHAFSLHEQILKQGSFHGWSCDQCDHVYNGKCENGDWELTETGVNQPTLIARRITYEAARMRAATLPHPNTAVAVGVDGAVGEGGGTGRGLEAGLVGFVRSGPGSV